jgi:hypothetical protein
LSSKNKKSLIKFYNLSNKHNLHILFWVAFLLQGRRVHDRMVVGFTTTYAISTYLH